LRFAVQLPTDRVAEGAEFVGPDAIAELACAAEAAGFDAVSVTDHPFPPARWVAAGGHHSLDPFVALSFAAAAATRVQLLTQVIVLPYRNPFLVAKAASTLDVLSGGRLILGVAAGYLEPEFAALGADFANRNGVTDEAIDAIRAAWTGEPVDLAGRGFVAKGNAQLPRPNQRAGREASGPPGHRDGPPIWVGGNSRRAIRRAVERGQGWHPFPAPSKLASHARTAAMESLEDLRAGIAFAREHAAKVGRTEPLDVCLVPFGFDMGARAPADFSRFQGQVEEYAAAGVTWLAMNVPATSRREWCDRAAALGEALLRGR
jgi:probable F420-dependent oxidoreductase